MFLCNFDEFHLRLCVHHPLFTFILSNNAWCFNRGAQLFNIYIYISGMFKWPLTDDKFVSLVDNAPTPELLAISDGPN